MHQSGPIELVHKPSKIDPCMYYRKDFKRVVCVDNTAFWSPDKSKIQETISELKALKFILTGEIEVDSFLGIKIDKDEVSNITMTQRGPIDTIIE